MYTLMQHTKRKVQATPVAKLMGIGAGFFMLKGLLWLAAAAWLLR